MRKRLQRVEIGRKCLCLDKDHLQKQNIQFLQLALGKTGHPEPEQSPSLQPSQNTEWSSQPVRKQAILGGRGWAKTLIKLQL